MAKNDNSDGRRQERRIKELLKHIDELDAKLATAEKDLAECRKEKAIIPPAPQPMTKQQLADEWPSTVEWPL